jgi:hypothetical protein
MEIEIVPEPTPEERAAIELALARAAQTAAPARCAWWQAGIEEALAGPDDDELR